MNEAKKLTLSKETLRCLDDQELTDVVGGGGGGYGGGGGGGGGHNQSLAVVGCISNDNCFNSILGCNGSAFVGICL